MMCRYRPWHENTVSNALLCVPTYSSGSANDYSLEIAHLVHKSCTTKVPILLEDVKGD